jgi:hypothetical protein
MIAAALALAAAAPATAVDAERAFAAMAQTEGQWTAFRAFASPAGIMFVPETVNAQEWLRDRKDPPVPIMWWPGRSWVSCDGSMAVNTGSWIRDGGKSVGYFTTVWAREQDGSWKWLLDHGDALAKPRPVGDVVKTRRGRCTGARPGKAGFSVLQMDSPSTQGIGSGGGGRTEGVALDGSLRWNSTVNPDRSRRVNAEIWTGTRYEKVLEDKVARQ